MSDYHPMVQKIKDLLDQNQCEYKTFEHEAVRTSAEAADIRPEYTITQGAKALILRIKKKGLPKDQAKQFIQMVVPGDAKFDPKKACAALNSKDIRFAAESEVEEITNGIKPGGVPPFGILFDLPVFVEKTLLDNEEIIFNAGDKRYSIAMKSTDYLTVVEPNIVSVV